MLKELFNQKQQYLNHFFETIDLKAADRFLDHLRKCQGNLVWTGIGKSGLIAKKIAVTMTATGTRALYLSPTNALHGDLGMLNANDLFILLSKSGESEELLHLIPFLRDKGVTVLGITSAENSRLAKMCDFSMYLPLQKELCPFNLAPTTSTVIQLIFGNVLAIALMRQSNFSMDQYAMNHPAGSIGKRIRLKVKDLMLTGTTLPICKPDDKLIDVLVELSNKKCGCVLVADKENTLQGIFTDGDLRRSLLQKGSSIMEMPMKALMISTPRTVKETALAWDAMQLMESNKSAITCLPVISEDNKILGLIRLHDIIQSGL